MYHLFKFLPFDIVYNIFLIKKINIIKNFWIKYLSYKKFILNQILCLPKSNFDINNDLLFNVTDYVTFYYFKKLNIIITGRESYFNQLYYCYYNLYLSINNYPFDIDGDFNIQDFYYTFNRYYLINAAFKFKWSSIINNILISNYYYI